MIHENRKGKPGGKNEYLSRTCSPRNKQQRINKIIEDRAEGWNEEKWNEKPPGLKKPVTHPRDGMAQGFQYRLTIDGYEWL